MKKIIYSILLILMSFSIVFAQDAPVSMGPAPLSNVKVTQEPTPFLQVGTRAFTQISSTPTFQFGKSFLESCAITNIGAPFTITFPGGLLYYNGTVYTWNQSAPFQLWSIDTTTGVHTLVFNLTGVPQANLTGMYWDGTTVYGVSSSLAVSQIFSVNMTSGVCTPIGSASATCAGAILLSGRMGAQYSAFSVDIVLDNLYKWNKTTGVATLVGPLGGNANFGQDGCFDNNDYKFYWMSYTTGPQLRLLDTATGTAGPVLCTYSNQATGIVCVPPAGGPGPISNNYSSAWCPAGTLPNIPAASLYNACAWLGDTLYMQAPDGTGTATTTIQRYAWGGGWSTGVPLPLARTQGTLTRCGDAIYFIGGSTTAGGAGATEVWAYKPSTGWVAKAPLPVGLNGHASVCWGDSVIFAIMGPWGTPSTAVYAYRVGSNTWITSTAFTGAARRSHAAGLWGNKIYVSNGFPFSNTFYIGTIGSNASTITWAAGPPMPLGGAITGRSRVGGVAYGDKFWVVGGNNSTGVPTSSDSTCVWNINAAVWTVIPGKPAPVHNNEAAVTYRIVGDTVKLFCPGGSSLAATTLNFDYLGCGPVVTNIGPNANNTPNLYSLMQNYPNPFNPATKITYALPRAGNIKLIVYDITGREVTTLVNEYKNPGVFTVDFDGTNLSSGVYFYRIVADEFTDVKKMLLVK